MYNEERFSNFKHNILSESNQIISLKVMWLDIKNLYKNLYYN